MSSHQRYLGSGMTSQRARDRLAQRLQTYGIRSQAVLDAIRFTPRHIFVDEALSWHAYENTALPIGYGQTISQPYIVARMTEALLSRGPLDNVLEIGTGCGYQTAILAQLVGEVYSVERIGALLEQAQARICELGLRNVKFLHGDGFLGWPEHAPFQGILVAAAPQQAPPLLLEQLSPEGCLVIPVGSQQEHQSLLLIQRKSTGGYRTHTLDAVNFVPLREGVD